jgi:hypothetical protein
VTRLPSFAARETPGLHRRAENLVLLSRQYALAAAMVAKFTATTCGAAINFSASLS